MVEIYGWAAKAAKHKDAVPFLFTLARVGLYSQLTLSESLTLARELRLTNPLIGNPAMIAEWGAFGVTAVNLWEFRRESGGKGVGDEWRCQQEINSLTRALHGQKLEHFERQAEILRNRLVGLPVEGESDE